MVMLRDQELRFTVHDCPDYYQLKVSVFTDDKRTDLVGETWIDLKNIIIPGGGQADQWQQLNCRGKYAGDIRLEITYYDSRPKPDKPAVKARPQPAISEQDGDSTRQRTPMKRRPLPSDPVTGEAPLHSPSEVMPASAPSRSPAVPDQYQTPARVHGKQPSQASFISNHSPLQSVEYQTPPSGHRPRYPDHYSPSPQGGQGQGHYQTPSRNDHPRQAQRQVDPYSTPPRQVEERDHASASPASPYHYTDARSQPRPEHYDLHFRDEIPQLPATLEDERPPPPPVHRSRHNSGGQELAQRNSTSFDTSQSKAAAAMPMRHDVLRNEAHRHSMSAYPGRPVFRGYDSAPSAMHSAPHEGQPYDMTLPRHHSHDSVYDQQYRHMQATVEDVPDSPGDSGLYNTEPRRQSGLGRSSDRSPGRPHNDEVGYDRDPSPAPLNLSRSREASPLHHSPSPMASRETLDNHSGYSPAVSHVAPIGYGTSPGRDPYSYSQAGQMQPPEYQHEWNPQPPSASNYSLAELPPSLVPGMDPNLSLELSDRIRDERSYDRRRSYQNMTTPIRGRHLLEGPSTSHEIVPVHAASAYNPQHNERRSPAAYATGPESRERQIREVSPNPYGNPEHSIRRKSVSPAPPPTEQRRLSNVPFGPDSFDAFNTALPTSRDERSIVDPDAKIITHDGKEIDPSDHLPVESWAPEPEAKLSKPAEPRTRPAPSGAQPMPPSGRRQLRIAARPQPQAPVAHPSYGPQDLHANSAPPSAGRNRLQKKTNQGSSAHTLPGSNALTPISSENYQDRQSSYGASHNPRHNTWDYPTENYEPSRGSGPPIPAKVPLTLMSGANGGADELALMQEMQHIDIGAGRSRRRGGY